MSINELEKAFLIIESHIESADFEGEQTHQNIINAEKILNVSLPNTYIKFLKKYGCGDIFGKEFYGILDKNNLVEGGVPNVVATNIGLRELYKFDDDYIIISDTGDGGYYALDTSRMNEDNECPVVLLDYVHGEEPFDVAEDFGQFLLDQLNEFLEDN